MALTLANFIVLIAFLYVLLGVLLALAFVFRGIGRVDRSASASPWTFRILMIPGVALLWPWMLGRWLSVSKKELP